MPEKQDFDKHSQEKQPLTRRYPLLAYLAEFREWRGPVTLAIVLALVKHTPVLFIPMYTAHILDVVIPHKDYTELWLCLLGMVGLIVMNMATHPLHILLFSKARRNVALRLRSRLCERIQQLTFSFHDAANSGRLHSKVMQDVEKLDALGKILIDPLLILVATSVAAFFILAYIQPRYLLVIALFIPIVILQRTVLSRRVQNNYTSLRVEQEKLNSEVNEMLGMLSITRAHATEDQDLQRLGVRLGEVREVGVKTDWITNILGAQIWGTTQLLNIAVLVTGAYLAITGRLTIGEVILAMSLVMMTVGGISAMMSQIEQFYGAAEAMRSINEVLTYPEIEENEGKPPFPQLKGEIAFNDVSFRYPGTEKPVLENLTLGFQPNQTIALVGSSGGGKTTFMKLLLGFYNPTGGAITIDGHDLRDHDKRTLRRQVGIVSQETFLFNGTILDNIIHGMGDVPMERVEEAARQAHAHDFICQLDNGYQTQIGDRGLKLSGGQKQRLAIARALLRNPRLLLLDEATSALDSQSERIVQEALETLMRDRTTFVVAHRLSTVRNADRILVFDKGRIVEDGPHRELINHGGVYSQLVELQAVK